MGEADGGWGVEPGAESLKIAGELSDWPLTQGDKSQVRGSW